jgi:hypothetical protein
MKHTIPLGTAVSFEGDPNIYIVSDYHTLLACEPPGDDCPVHFGEGCYEEPYICVKREIGTARPLSKLKHIFDRSGKGRDATDVERTPA